MGRCEAVCNPSCNVGQVCDPWGECEQGCAHFCDEMVAIPAGTFWMGCNKEDWYGLCDFLDERPYHEVYLDSYAIDKYEVTVSEYQSCVDAGACNELPENWAIIFTECNWGARRMDHPMNCITWYEGEAFCRWAGKRLCTETEWEKAAKGGCEFYTDCKHDSPRYPWGMEEPDSDRAIVCLWPEGYCWGTQPIGSKPTGASLYGVLDMIGNVSEWVADWYFYDYYEDSPMNNPPGPEGGDAKVIRGGSYGSSDLDYVNAVYRSRTLPTLFSEYTGVRCCHSSQ
jgi:formylglycine-generating enzyme required for sulfatase activity